jgi:cytochrome c oxidase subunit I+III
MACTSGAFALDMAGHLQAGLDPRAQAWSATVGMLLGYQGFHVAVVLLMGGYVLARSWSGRLQPAARATLDNTLLMWHCVTAQGLLAALAVQLAPRLA